MSVYICYVAALSGRRGSRPCEKTDLSARYTSCPSKSKVSTVCLRNRGIRSSIETLTLEGNDLSRADRSIFPQGVYPLSPDKAARLQISTDKYKLIGHSIPSPAVAAPTP